MSGARFLAAVVRDSRWRAMPDIPLPAAEIGGEIAPGRVPAVESRAAARHSAERALPRSAAAMGTSENARVPSRDALVTAHRFRETPAAVPEPVALGPGVAAEQQPGPATTRARGTRTAPQSVDRQPANTDNTVRTPPTESRGERIDAEPSDEPLRQVRTSLEPGLPTPSRVGRSAGPGGDVPNPADDADTPGRDPREAVEAVEPSRSIVPTRVAYPAPPPDIRAAADAGASRSAGVTPAAADAPRVHIGVVEVIVAAPAEKPRPAESRDTSTSLASRRYLRNV